MLYEASIDIALDWRSLRFRRSPVERDVRIEANQDTSAFIVGFTYCTSILCEPEEEAIVCRSFCAY